MKVRKRTVNGINNSKLINRKNKREIQRQRRHNTAMSESSSCHKTDELNEKKNVPIYYLAKPLPRERAWKN
jgi:hypothetical protein